MNILMLGRWLPLPRAGDARAREHHLGRWLARGHRLTLGFVTDQPDAAGPVAALRAEFGDLEFALLPRAWKAPLSALEMALGGSYTLAYHRSEALARRLADRARATRYDLVAVSASTMIPYALALPPALPLFMDWGELESRRLAREARRRGGPLGTLIAAEARRLRRAEALMARRVARSVVASPQAAATLAALAPGARPVVVPDGLDPEHFAPVLRLPPAPAIYLASRFEDPAEAESAARFCRTVLPRVRAHRPDAHCLVVGPEARPWLLRLGGIGGVTVAAPVSDIRPFLHRSAVAAAPVPAGDGLPATVLAAMATGLPLVATPGGVEGLAVRPDRDAYVTDDPEVMAERIGDLLERPALRAEMGAQGTAFVRSRYGWDPLIRRLAQEVEAAGPAGTRRPRPTLEAPVGAMERG